MGRLRVNGKIDMLHGPLLWKILLFSLPLAASGILQLLFNAADIAVIGQFAGSTSLAAVGSNNALVNLLVTLFMGVSVGVNITIARYIGQNDIAKVHRAVHTAMLSSLICGVVLAVIGFFLAPELLLLISTPEDVIPLASLYLRIYFLGMPALMAYNFGAAILRSIGDTRRPLYFLIMAGIINVILNLIFVIVFQMDVAGVALATVISQCCSATLVVLCLVQESGMVHLDLRHLFIDKDILLQVLRFGIPTGLQGIVFSLSNLMIQSGINSFGSIVMAGSAASTSMESFVFTAADAFGQAAITFTSQNMGAKQYKRCDRAILLGYLGAGGISAILGIVILYFGVPLTRIYSSDPEVIEAAMVKMWYFLPFEIFNAGMIAGAGAMRGLGYSVLPTVVSLAGVCGIRLIWIVTVFAYFQTVESLYLVYPFSWGITALVHVICILIVRKKIYKRDPVPVAESL